MPKLMVFAPCEKVIISRDENESNPDRGSVGSHAQRRTYRTASWHHSRSRCCAPHGCAYEVGGLCDVATRGY